MTIEAIDALPSRPFKGFDWSEHTDVTRLIDDLFAECTLSGEVLGDINSRITSQRKPDL